jgi:hypothetical protein
MFLDHRRVQLQALGFAFEILLLKPSYLAVVQRPTPRWRVSGRRAGIAYPDTQGLIGAGVRFDHQIELRIELANLT